MSRRSPRRRGGLMAARAALSAALAVTARDHRLRPLPLEALPGPNDVRHGRGLDEFEAFLEAIYLAVTCFEVPRPFVGAQLGISKQAVQKAVQRVALRRDDDSYDSRLERLETALGFAA